MLSRRVGMRVIEEERLEDLAVGGPCPGTRRRSKRERDCEHEQESSHREITSDDS
jgi:hypothetical protein